MVGKRIGKPKWTMIPNTQYPHVWYCRETGTVKFPTDGKRGWGYMRRTKNDKR